MGPGGISAFLRFALLYGTGVFYEAGGLSEYAECWNYDYNVT
jgi:hypothetical protein